MYLCSVKNSIFADLSEHKEGMRVRVKGQRATLRVAPHRHSVNVVGRGSQRGGSPFSGCGVSPNNCFSSLLFAAAGGEREENKVCGDTPTPRLGDPAPLH